MNLTPEQTRELERRGLDSIRMLLTQAVGAGRTASVPLRTPGGDPLRSDVEDWLLEQDRNAQRSAEAKHAELMRWAKIAGIGAVIGAIAAVASVILALR